MIEPPGGCERTLNISHTLGQDLLQDLGVLQLLLHLGDDSLGKLLLLALLDLALVADPGVQDSFSLGGKGSPLLQLVSLSLELGSLLEIKLSEPGHVLGWARHDRVPWKPRTGSW